MNYFHPSCVHEDYTFSRLCRLWVMMQPFIWSWILSYDLTMTITWSCIAYICVIYHLVSIGCSGSTKKLIGNHLYFLLYNRWWSLCTIWKQSTRQQAKRDPLKSSYRLSPSTIMNSGLWALYPMIVQWKFFEKPCSPTVCILHKIEGGSPSYCRDMNWSKTTFWCYTTAVEIQMVKNLPYLLS